MLPTKRLPLTSQAIAFIANSEHTNEFGYTEKYKKRPQPITAPDNPLSKLLNLIKWQPRGNHRKNIANQPQSNQLSINKKNTTVEKHF